MKNTAVAVLLFAIFAANTGGTIQAQTVDTQRLSVGPTAGEQPNGGVYAAAVSGDAHFAVFDGSGFPSNDTRPEWFVRDVAAQQTGAVVVPHQSSSTGAGGLIFVSDDARYVAYQLQQGGYPETQVFDRTSATIIADLGHELHGLSRNGRWLVTIPYSQSDGFLVVTDLSNHVGVTFDFTRTGTDANGTWSDAYAVGDSAISDDGQWLAYNLGNGAQTQTPPHTHDDGMYLYDMVNHVSMRIDANTAYSAGISITPDGRYLAYCSTGEGVTTVRVYDRVAGYSHRVSNAGGVVPNSHSRYPSISSDGRYVAFSSLATNIVSGDTNGHEDVFRFDRQAQKVMRVSLSSADVQGNGDSLRPSISADGAAIAYLTSASNLVSGDTNGLDDAYLTKVVADTSSVPSTPPSPTPPTGGGSTTPSTSPSTPVTPAGSTSTSSSGSGNRCGFGAGAVGLALMLGGVRRRRFARAHREPIERPI